MHGKVYDISKFDDHPGGMDPIVEWSGKDATEAFDAAGHDGEVVRDMDKRFLIGSLMKPRQRESKEEVKGRLVTMEEL